MKFKKGEKVIVRATGEETTIGETFTTLFRREYLLLSMNCLGWYRACQLEKVSEPSIESRLGKIEKFIEEEKKEKLEKEFTDLCKELGLEKKIEYFGTFSCITFMKGDYVKMWYSSMYGKVYTTKDYIDWIKENKTLLKAIKPAKKKAGRPKKKKESANK